MPKKIVKIEYRVRYEATVIVDEEVEANEDLFMDVDIPTNPANELIEQSSEIIEIREASKEDMDALSEHWGMFIKNQNCVDSDMLGMYYCDQTGIQLHEVDAKNFFDIGTDYLEAHDG